GSGKASDYLRPTIGFSGISLRQWNTSANYHSIQLSISRRLQHGFAFTMSYTGSVSHSQGDPDQFLCPLGMTTCTPEQSLAANQERNYTASGSRPHNLVFNYNYLVPKGSTLLRKMGDNFLARGVL